MVILLITIIKGLPYMSISATPTNKSQLPIAMSLLSRTILATTLTSITILTGTILASNTVLADDNTSVVDQINITVPIACTISGTGMQSHNAEITNGTYQANIGSTTLHAFCNDNEGFAIYAAGYTGNEIGGTNSNKLVGTAASSNATIVTGTATSAGNPDVSNWAMKLAITQDSGDTTGTNAFTIDNSFNNYHAVPNEYTKVAHKDSNTDMTANTGGVKLTTTYAAYISKTQPADTYTGQVVYTLVHPSAAVAVEPKKVGVNYIGNGETFANDNATNFVKYTILPMYIKEEPTISKTANLDSDGTQNGAYYTDDDIDTVEQLSFSNASKLKVVVRYGLTADTADLYIVEGAWDRYSDLPDTYYEISPELDVNRTDTFVINGDTVTIAMEAWFEPDNGYDYGYYAEVYPLYDTEQSGTVETYDFVTTSVDSGTYSTTANWHGSWYGDIGGERHEFANESEVKDFIVENGTAFSGMTIDLMRSLSFSEAYAKANKQQVNGYYLQQDLNLAMCRTIATGQNTTVRDVRDNNTYVIGRLKDGNCWMLDNLALDPTDSTTAANMNGNTNASAAAISNYLNGGSSTTGWSNQAVVNKTSNWNTTNPNNAYINPYINKESKDSLAEGYGPTSVNGQIKAGIYYNYCAATVGTYCYAQNEGIDLPDTMIDAPQDICPANWRMPTGDDNGDFGVLISKYSHSDATDSNSLQYNLSIPFSGYFSANSVGNWNIGAFIWSSTYTDKKNSSMFYLKADNDAAYNGTYYRYLGFPVRCLVGK